MTQRKLSALLLNTVVTFTFRVSESAKAGATHIRDPLLIVKTPLPSVHSRREGIVFGRPAAVNAKNAESRNAAERNFAAILLNMSLPVKINRLFPKRFLLKIYSFSAEMSKERQLP